MVRIVEEAPDPSVVKRVTCRGCGARLEYVPNDVREGPRGTDYGGGPDGYDYIDCPKCGKRVVVKSW